MWLIVAPAADWSRAVAFAIESAALVLVIATSRARPDVRRVRTLAGALVGAALVAAIATGALPVWAELVGAGLLSLAIPFALVGGLLRLVRARGVRLQAVFGALAVYLLIGLAFAWAIGLVAELSAQAYFSDGTDPTQSSRAYFSFTVLTTTGFGDLTAATPAGRALAVVEMLAGQLYLVTVIGVVIGSFRRR